MINLKSGTHEATQAVQGTDPVERDARMSQSPDVQQKDNQIPLLTGLRGLAAGIVLVSHSAIVGMLPSALGYGFGQVGVMIFFVLSGFLMAHLYLGREPGKRNVSSYIRARVGRVVPLYLSVVFASIVISNSIYPDFRYQFPIGDTATIAKAVLFVQAPWELWTIPVEVQFYAVFIIIWLLRPKLGWPAIFLVGAMVMVPAVVYLGIYRIKPAILPTYGFAFFIGVVAAEFLPRIRKLKGRLPAVAGLVFLALLFVNLPAVRDQFHLSVAPGNIYTSTWLDPVTWFIVCGLFVCCLMESPGLAVLDSRPFVFLGNISYGLYLLHYPILEITARFVGTSLLGLLVGAGASVGLAWASYRWFELPVMEIIRGRRALRTSRADGPRTRA
jgi:peptidoglycan/LPS O-acetylase OafA/YrhL